MPRLILASASPRRSQLLRLLGIPFEVDAPEVDETTDLPPRKAVQLLSRRKSLAGAALHPGCVVLAADTLVALEDTPLGKPRDEAEAFRMLRGLSGREHHVYTGVCCVAPDGRGTHGQGRRLRPAGRSRRLDRVAAGVALRRHRPAASPDPPPPGRMRPGPRGMIIK